MQAETICLYLIDRVFAVDSSSDARLHLIYLINDLLHNRYVLPDNDLLSRTSKSSLRKGQDELRLQVSRIIVPVYCLTVDQSNEERRQKLIKVTRRSDLLLLIIIFFVSYSSCGKRINISPKRLMK